MYKEVCMNGIYYEEQQVASRGYLAIRHCGPSLLLFFEALARAGRLRGHVRLAFAPPLELGRGGGLRFGSGLRLDNVGPRLRNVGLGSSGGLSSGNIISCRVA